MNTLRTYFWQSVRSYLAFTVLLGFMYPLLIMAIGQTAFPKKAQGSFLEANGKIVGSSLIAQKFESPRYFWPRPSAVDYNPLASGGSNLGPTSKALKEAVDARKQKLAPDAPEELLFASGSGLDPEIDKASALYQISRVAHARGVPEETIRNKVTAHLEARDLGFLGEERINVLKLNLSLDL